jgi:hypothetical protein
VKVSNSAASHLGKDGDFKIELTELLGQYNSNNYSVYSSAPAGLMTEDGYVPAIEEAIHVLHMLQTIIHKIENFVRRDFKAIQLSIHLPILVSSTHMKMAFAGLRNKLYKK